VATGWIAAGFVFLWNSGFVGALYGLPDAGPFTLLLWRYLAVTGLLLIPVAASGRWPSRLDATLRSAVAGVLAHGVWLGCVLVALDVGVPAGIVALVTALQPLTTGALSGPVVGEATSVRQWVGLAVGFAGVAVAVSARVVLDPTVPWPAYLVPFGSVAGITVASLLQRRATVVNAASLPPMTDMLVQCAATAVVFAPLAILFERLATRWTATFITTMVWLVLAVSLGAYALMWRLLERRDATRVASLFYLSPPVTMLMTFAAFGERPALTDLAGMALAAVGVAIVQLPARQSAG
jgi:drug/metabolite transporter (DMT)-like permease